MIQTVLEAYGIVPEQVTLFGTGLINRTWKVSTGSNVYIVQRVADKVFKQPQDIASNVHLIAEYLSQNAPGYLFVRPVASLSGEEMICLEGDGWYRVFPFVEGSHTEDVVPSPAQAYEAAAAFGRFTRLLDGFDVAKLKVTIPAFHDLELRHRQFLQALKEGNPQRIGDARTLINELLAKESIVKRYRQLKASPLFRLRVTHHDTKISNVLFNDSGQALCVIDLDTVMPGYFISDVGDMMRTYLSPVSEEEQDVDKIIVREAFYTAVVEGYRHQVKDMLTKAENDAFFYAGQFMIYMQALRFLTDHLNNDVYYGALYEGHNLVRATNQATLLQRYEALEDK